VTNRKMSAEQAAEEGALVGEPYTPPNRPAVFDVPAYDDIADLQLLFKRFANTVAGSNGDNLSGTYNFKGKVFINGQPVDPTDAYHTVDKTKDFNVSRDDVLSQTRFMCNFVTDGVIGVPTDTVGIQDGARITVVQVGKGKVTVEGVNVVGVNKTKNQYQMIEVMYHNNLWWCLAGGGGGGGNEGAPSKPEPSWNQDFSEITWEPVSGSASETYGYGALVTPGGDMDYRLEGTSLLIDQATAGIEFEIQVWGVNAAGQGEFSDPLTHTWTGVDAPSLTATSGPAQITAQWTQIAEVTGYRLAYKKTTDTDWKYIDESSTAFGDIIGGLEQVEYQVKIQSVKKPVGSAWSTIVKVVPGPGETTTPAITHSAKSTFTITNYNPNYLYTTDATAGTATVSGDKVTLSAGNVQFLVKSQYAQGAPVKQVAGELRQYTYTKQNFPYPCGSYECNCRDEWSGCGCECGGGGCGCYPPPTGGSAGQCGCPGNMCWYGNTRKCDSCTSYCDDYRDVKNATPSGFEDKHGEWSKVG